MFLKLQRGGNVSLLFTPCMPEAQQVLLVTLLALVWLIPPFLVASGSFRARQKTPQSSINTALHALKEPGCREGLPGVAEQSEDHCGSAAPQSQSFLKKSFYSPSSYPPWGHHAPAGLPSSALLCLAVCGVTRPCRCPGTYKAVLSVGML